MIKEFSGLLFKNVLIGVAWCMASLMIGTVLLALKVKLVGFSWIFLIFGLVLPLILTIFISFKYVQQKVLAESIKEASPSLAQFIAKKVSPWLTKKSETNENQNFEKSLEYLPFWLKKPLIFLLKPYFNQFKEISKNPSGVEKAISFTLEEIFKNKVENHVQPSFLPLLIGFVIQILAWFFS